MTVEEYLKRVEELEEEGMCTSDAQSIVDMEIRLAQGTEV